MTSQRLFVPTEVLPQEGDIVLEQQARSGVSWNLSRYRGPAEVSTKSREDAVRIARAVAGESVVDVWSFEKGTYRNVETQRPKARDIPG